MGEFDPAPAVDATGLVKRFGGVTAVDGVDLRVEVGQVHALLGANGAGKTTMLRMLLGLVRPDQGALRIFDGRRTGHGVPDGLAGFVETPAFYPYLSARRNLELLVALDGGTAGTRPDIDAALDAVELDRARDRRVRGFSLGMRQRLGIAAALVRRPRLLVLDEPTNGLDLPGARAMRSLVARLAGEGRTVLLSSHDMSEVESLCDTVTILHAGRVVHAGSVRRLREQAPAAAHRLHTSDDTEALSVARTVTGPIQVSAHVDGGLVVRARRERLDGYVVALGRRGIAVRGLHLEVSPLESLFLRVTGAGEDPAQPEPDRVTVSEDGEAR